MVGRFLASLRRRGALLEPLRHAVTRAGVASAPRDPEAARLAGGRSGDLVELDTHTEEFYEVTDAEPELVAFQVELRAWETVYNTIRPHQSLGYLTPAEYLASVGIDVYRTY